MVDKDGKLKGIYGGLDKPWQNKADLVAERKTYEDALNAINNKIDSLKTQAKDKVNKTIKSKKEELKNKIPGLDKLKF